MTSVVLLAVLTGCERVSQVIEPDTTTTPTEATLKIGVIQPSNTFTTFSQGAETARAEINERGGVLGMEIAFITRNNQPVASEPPTPEASVSAAKALIEMENVFALLGPVYPRMLLQSVRLRNRHSGSCFPVPAVQTSLKLEIMSFSLRSQTRFKGR